MAGHQLPITLGLARQRTANAVGLRLFDTVGLIAGLGLLNGGLGILCVLGVLGFPGCDGCSFGLAIRLAFGSCGRRAVVHRRRFGLHSLCRFNSRSLRRFGLLQHQGIRPDLLLKALRLGLQLRRQPHAGQIAVAPHVVTRVAQQQEQENDSQHRFLTSVIHGLQPLAGSRARAWAAPQRGLRPSPLARSA